MGKVDTRIFATGRKNMVAKGVTHIFLHHFTAYPLEIKKERKEGEGEKKSVGSLCSENQPAQPGTNCTGSLHY